MQREITVTGSGGDFDGTYMQFIITDTGATGDAAASAFSTARGNLNFTNEDFIKINNRGGGLASKQTIIESKFDSATLIEDRFSATTTYKTGWAQGFGKIDVWVDILQNTSQLKYDGDKGVAASAYELYDETAVVQGDGPSTDNTRVEVSQRLYLEGTPGAGGDAIQKFKYTRISGVYTDAATDMFGGLINPNPLLPGGTN